MSLIKDSIKTAEKIGALGLVTYGSYKLLSQNLFDRVFKKRDESNIKDNTFNEWLSKSNVTQVRIKSYDGIKLNSYKIENNNTNDYIILLHGIWSNKTHMYKYAFEFDKLGYNVLLIDQRCCGESEGNYYSYGFKESLDLLRWINYLVTKNNQVNITLFGVSMGASTCMMTTNNYLPSNVKTIISDCGFSSFKEQIEYVLINDYKIIKPDIILKMFEQIMYDRFGFKFKDISCKDALKNNEIPILFIHGEDDDFVPYKMSKILYNNNKGVKKYFTIANKKHAECIYCNKYFDVINNFIKQYQV